MGDDEEDNEQSEDAGEHDGDEEDDSEYDENEEGVFTIHLMDEHKQPLAGRWIMVFYPGENLRLPTTRKRETDDNGSCEFPTLGMSHILEIYSEEFYGYFKRREVLLSHGEEIYDGKPLEFTLCDGDS
jgi:hypothetical protein